MAKMHKFRVIEGKHYDKQTVERGGRTFIEPVEYKKGQIVETEQELDVMFAGKFVRLTGPTKPPRDYVANLDDVQQTRKTMDKPHHLEVEEESDDYEEEGEEKTGKDEVVGEKSDDKVKTKTSTKKNADVSPGKDVTGKFPKADEAGLKVYKNDEGEYFVIDPDRPKARLNKDKLPSAKKVKSFLTKRAGE